MKAHAVVELRPSVTFAQNKVVPWGRIQGGVGKGANRAWVCVARARAQACNGTQQAAAYVCRA